jgi:hypothetical protein
MTTQKPYFWQRDVGAKKRAFVAAAFLFLASHLKIPVFSKKLASEMAVGF